MRIPGVKSLRTFSRWIRARILGGALILAYHRIGSASEASADVCVSPEHFAEHLQVLREQMSPIRLSELVQHLRERSLPEKSVAITFDDGYADNLYSAKPLLEQYEIPATVFVCTGYLGKEFWWDELERLVICSSNELQSLHLQLEGKLFQWDRVDASSQADQSALRHEFRRTLYHFLILLDPDARNRAMDMVRSWSGAPSTEISAPRAMSNDELQVLASSGLIELGAHTRYHPMLPQLSTARQKEEIEASKRDLESLLGISISGFAYPNGRATQKTKQLVRELGFAYACTSLHDVVRPGSDVYGLTRFWQHDVDGETFAKGLNRWMSVKVY